MGLIFGYAYFGYAYMVKRFDGKVKWMTASPDRA